MLLLDYSPALQILMSECDKIVGVNKAVTSPLAEGLSKIERATETDALQTGSGGRQECSGENA